MKLKRIVALVLALVIVLSVSMVSASSLPRRTLVRNSISVDICMQDGNIVASCIMEPILLFVYIYRKK